MEEEDGGGRRLIQLIYLRCFFCCLCCLLLLREEEMMKKKKRRKEKRKRKEVRRKRKKERRKERKRESVDEKMKKKLRKKPALLKKRKKSNSNRLTFELWTRFRSSNRVARAIRKYINVAFLNSKKDKTRVVCLREDETIFLILGECEKMPSWQKEKNQQPHQKKRKQFDIAVGFVFCELNALSAVLC